MWSLSVVRYHLKRLQLLRRSFFYGGFATVLLGMVVAALQILGTLLQLLVGILLLGLITKDRLVDHGVENLLLPAVILAAKRLQRTSLLVLADKMTCTPAFTNLKRIVEEQMRLASEVLPVVCVATLGFIVLSAEGAPLSLEEEHVEVLVAGHLVDQRRLYVSFSVGE